MITIIKHKRPTTCKRIVQAPQPGLKIDLPACFFQFPGQFYPGFFCPSFRIRRICRAKTGIVHFVPDGYRFADFSSVQKCFGKLVGRIEYKVLKNLQLNAIFVCRRNHSIALRQIHCHRLLYRYVFSCFARFHCHFTVKMMRNKDFNSVYCLIY